MSCKKLYCIREFGYLGIENNNDVVGIPKSAFQFLLKALQKDQATYDFQPFLKLTIKNSQVVLQVQNYVGVIQTPCGTQIEILPKLTNEDDIEVSRSLLIKMLRVLRNSPFKQSAEAHIRDAKMPLLEIFIAQFFDLVNLLVKRGIKSDYVTVRKNSNYLKGRLLVNQHIRTNVFHQERFYIEYAEYMIDRPANRLIKTTILLISQLSHNSQNQRLARELGFLFEAVPKSDDIDSDFQKLNTDRTMMYYQEVLVWCRLLLKGHGPTTAEGKFNAISLLYPMERIFEDYVAHCLRKKLDFYFELGCSLKTQARKLSLVNEHMGSPIFNIRPDLVVQKNRQNICVMDTKWKLLNSGDRRNKYGISQADMYQLYAYGHKYMSETDSKNLMLIYPKTDGFTQALAPFIYENGFRLDVVPFDLLKGCLEGSQP